MILVFSKKMPKQLKLAFQYVNETMLVVGNYNCEFSQEANWSYKILLGANCGA